MQEGGAVLLLTVLLLAPLPGSGLPENPSAMRSWGTQLSDQLPLGGSGAEGPMKRGLLAYVLGPLGGGVCGGRSERLLASRSWRDADFGSRIIRSSWPGCPAVRWSGAMLASRRDIHCDANGRISCMPSVPGMGLWGKGAGFSRTGIRGLRGSKDPIGDDPFMESLVGWGTLVDPESPKKAVAKDSGRGPVTVDGPAALSRGEVEGNALAEEPTGVDVLGEAAAVEPLGNNEGRAGVISLQLGADVAGGSGSDSPGDLAVVRVGEWKSVRMVRGREALQENDDDEVMYPFRLTSRCLPITSFHRRVGFRLN